MLKMEVTRSKTGGRCTWEAGGFNGDNYGYAQLITDKFGNPKVSMMKNTKGENICGNHQLFAVKEGEFIVTDDFKNGLHHIKVMQIVDIMDVCDKSFIELNICWEYKNKQWSSPSPQIFNLKNNIAEVINLAMEKAMYEGCTEGFYYKEKGN